MRVNGDGSVARPFDNLAGVNALTLHAGDRVLFKRGTICRGTLAPRGSGSAGAPIVIGAYGSGPKPAIDADGHTEAVLLRNESHIQVSDLDLSAPGNNTAVRRGVYVYARNAGSVSGITLQHLTIHDVRGLLPEHGGSLLKLGAGKYADASGGIIVEAAGSRVPTAFNDLRILDNTLRNVDREGIYLWSNWCRRPQLASGWHPLCTAKWDPATHVVIRGNHLDDIGGDGIAPMTSQGVLVEGNTLDGFNMRGHGYNAGMWTANSDDVVFQHNVVTGGHSTRDGMAYDVDNSTDGVVFQYSLSYANAGGFFLLCPWNTPVRNFTIRYNISIDDHARGFEVCDGALQHGRIDHNTIYIGDGVSQQVVEAKTKAPLDVRFVDNIVDRGARAGKVGWTLDEKSWVVDHNDFHGVPVPAWATATVTGDPRFADPGSVKPDGYRLRAGSAALGSGITLPDDGGRDFFGNAVAAGQPTNVGAWAGKEQ
ncbi:MAG TPA: right-handed parallel beta-helix repeat-containing protein [Rhodanobacteraceae bacterium]